MGRKAFVNDLRDAALPGRFAQISTVASGDDDGTIEFVFHSAALPVGEIAVDAMVSDVSEYPSDHTYFLFTTSEHVPPVVTASIESVQPSLSGRSISHMVREVAAAINLALSGGGRLNVDPESEGGSDAADEDDDEHLVEDDSDADMWSSNSPIRESQHAATATDTNDTATSTPAVKARIRSDLRLTKKAGFKVGILGNLDLGGTVCVSIRIAKLGISEEAINAWGLKRNHYLVLLIRYGHGYKNIEDVKEETASGVCKTEFRVALCQQYKPSITEAINAFSQLPAQAKSSNTVKNEQIEPDRAAQGAPRNLEPLFIGGPLNDLLTRLPAILKYRIACSFSWTGAELFFNEIQSKAAASIDATKIEFTVSDPPASQALPKMVTADHLGETTLPRLMSLPLVAMQFLLRHLVRCTEFCLVCHCKTDKDFEALKPYVCSKPLCLFQYMALGFGPSIEWEILSQPYVVDLLVSFCYASAQGHRLKDFPIGIDLKVPVLPRSIQASNTYRYWRMMTTTPTTAPNTPADPIMPKPFSAKFDSKERELLLVDQKAPGPVNIGDWIVLMMKSMDGAYHARVEGNFFPTIKLGVLIHVPTTDPKLNVGGAASTSTVASSTSVGFLDAEVYRYDQSFDVLPDHDKRNAITCILDTLPDVLDMKAFLEQNQHDPSLRRYRHRISESALNLLRWIIASNRSCIMQVDRSPSSTTFASVEDRVSGMAEWLQFRFAQGAPDKEQRFVDCVKEVSTRLNLNKHPTFFAWHGSPLSNWHGIVREGLHFNDHLHGRAYGNGVYMSSQATTSMGYSGGPYYSSAGVLGLIWRNSKLRISTALALNEVVNAPQEFLSSKPHYVVDQIDWIQTRYLFIKGDHSELGHDLVHTKPPKLIYQQDPHRTAVGDLNQPISIPITAISKSRRLVTITSPQARGSKKVKITGSATQEQAKEIEDDVESMMTDPSDIEHICSDHDEDDDHDDKIPSTSNLHHRDHTEEASPPKTDFQPNQLSASTLPLLAPPTNASTSATTALLKTLKQTLSIQKTTPLHELGWSIDESLITNIYQWIVELHSFDPSLPLARDMKAQNVTSIVLEMRFSTNFPMAPPFVRVIRPRFLPFIQGGGGHVTGGGALCMELLTDSGWSPVSSIESVLLQVRMAICSLEPKPARLAVVPKTAGMRPGRAGAGGGFARAALGGAGADAGAEYHVREAVDAYKRACMMHGWAVPKEFDDFLKG